MSIAITGGFGFLGWHTACRLRALEQVDAVRLGRDDFAEADRLVSKLIGVGRIIHIAGVNRAESDDAVERGNVELAEKLVAAIRANGAPVELVYANSVQAELDNPYGRGKARAAEILKAVVAEVGGSFANMMLPNLFGEHGRPGYNSFVATFAHEVAAGRSPKVTYDREIPLLHAQDAAAALIGAVGSDVREVVPGEPVAISAVLRALEHFHKLYDVRGEIPDIADPFMLKLFNTYRAAAFTDGLGASPVVRSDERGDLFEVVRSHGGTGMTYASTTKPGQKRGEHYHLQKVERFLVVSGEAEIELRRLLHGEVIRLRVTGDSPTFVDMPTLWVHNIRNVGNSDLLTLFWADQLLDPDNPDQFPETIAMEAPA